MADTRYIRGLVVSRRDLGAGLWIVRVRTDEPVSFLAGQYVTVGLPGPERVVERPYSVVSAPGEPELEFFLELVPGGELTPQLYSVPVGGGVLVRRAAKGRLLLDRASGRPRHFMVATVTGVAPFVSIVRDLVRTDSASCQVTVLHSASVSEELGYREELASLAERLDWFRYIPTISRPWLDPAWRGEVGRAEDVARKHMDALGLTPRDTTAYVCGNPRMIENMKGLLRRAGFPKEAVKEEFFWVAPKGEGA